MKLIEISPDWILTQLPHRLITFHSNEFVELIIDTHDSCWVHLALDTLGIKYKYREYISDDNYCLEIIGFNIEDIKLSCPSFYYLIIEAPALRLIKGSAVMGKYLFKN